MKNIGPSSDVGLVRVGILPEVKIAKALSALRHSLVKYWEKTQDTERRGLDLVPYFCEYALTVFDARAEERLHAHYEAPESFLRSLRDELVSDVVTGIVVGVWGKAVMESLSMAGISTLEKHSLFIPEGSCQIEMVLRDRIDEFWVERSSQPLEQGGTPATSTWDQVEIFIPNDFEAQIVIPPQPQCTVTFESMGFADQRGKTGRKPNKPWALLLAFARQNGRIDLTKMTQYQKRKLEQGVWALNEALKKYFRIPVTPIAIHGASCECKFRIRAREDLSEP